MKFSWRYEKEEPRLLKTFLNEQGISRGLLAKIKYQGGWIGVNGVEKTVRYVLSYLDEVTVIIPDEGEHETLLPDVTPVDIIFEDEHYLIVNKPVGVASIPAQYHPNGTMANRVKHYYQSQNYPNQVIHVVTRLDRDTTGLMLFAKHGYAHAMMDKELRAGRVTKKYLALVGDDTDKLLPTGKIDFPIKRVETSIIERTVGEDGLPSLTEYWLKKRTKDKALVEVQLHTGRTHQIRVHFAAIGCPLIGDELYGGRMDCGLERQALHCHHLSFYHPFTKECLNIFQEMPDDMQNVHL
ncbi:RluA family pseudouridine synthase [Vagococcus sp.]|uniref:RluA family pseudouridine synthase n=1 Tax=Vagococcus sp. TaxID=1933889 RepID=UPI000EC4559D|nr:RluA family pseudouridine synthase [Vagococcus sp.]HCT95501.1 RluA family pseudouridine synthase [Vagococcus sp.]